MLVYLGAEEDCPGSAAVFGHSQKATGVVGESVSVNELMGLAETVKVALLLKYVLEELSGATQGCPTTTEMTVPGSAAPMQLAVSSSMMNIYM